MEQKELAIVIPVYNEAANLEKLFSDWNSIFMVKNINNRFIFINDGSTDKSAEVLLSLQKINPNIIFHDQVNSGHGAAILKGYQEGISADWIFQIDSDHQYNTETFTEMWKNRNCFDFLIAERVEVNASMSRKFISFICSRSVRMIFGKSISDINSPYRLIKSNLLQQCLEKIPADSFAPNVIMSALIIKSKTAIYIAKLIFRKSIVPHKSKLNSRLFKGSVQTFLTLFKI